MSDDAQKAKELDIINAQKAKELERITLQQLDIINAQRAKTLERVTQQLDIIEQLITMLMDGIDFSDLKTSRRLNLVLKLMTQHARTVKLYDDISGDNELSSSQKAFIDKLMRFMADRDLDDTSSSEEDSASSYKEGA